MEDFLEEIFLTEEDIAKIVKRLGEEITRDYKDKNLLLVGILKGSMIFLSDLMKEIKINTCEVDFMCASSYVGTMDGGGKVNVLKDLSIDIKNYDVLIVEDILESGYTLQRITSMLKERNPKSLKICTLLDKPQRHKVDITSDYVGLVIPNRFVIGYGMDYNEKYRNLPYIGILDSKYR